MIEQRTEEWRLERAGVITGSAMRAVMLERDPEPFKTGPRKGQAKPPPKALTDYMHQLVAERLTGRPRKTPKVPAMQWGIDVEPYASAAYEARTGYLVTPAAFTIHPDYPFIGASPDFLVDEVGGGEIKCPESSEVHLDTLLNGLPEEHIAQIQAGLAVTGRQWWDFVSYHPHFPEAHRLYVQRVPRDDAFIARMVQACVTLNAEVEAILLKLSLGDA